jgi:hypothetical protein
MISSSHAMTATTRISKTLRQMHRATYREWEPDVASLCGLRQRS